MRINPFKPAKATMYRADKFGHLVEIVIFNPNTEEKMLAKRQKAELIAKIGRKRTEALDPETREILRRQPASIFGLGNCSGKKEPLQWDRARLITPLKGNTDILDHIRGSTYPTTLPHYARII